MELTGIKNILLPSFCFATISDSMKNIYDKEAISRLQSHCDRLNILFSRYVRYWELRPELGQSVKAFRAESFRLTNLLQRPERKLPAAPERKDLEQLLHRLISMSEWAFRELGELFRATELKILKQRIEPFTDEQLLAESVELYFFLKPRLRLLHRYNIDEGDLLELQYMIRTLCDSRGISSHISGRLPDPIQEACNRLTQKLYRLDMEMAADTGKLGKEYLSVRISYID
ncbi:hypothetical protein [Rurimicrobium arvi]|uniref:Uncharacterized protein n=1 Tax=Rurimicrobium arvi TaxID=2049916 RepID=A0ABP8N102_9BACT